MAAVVGDGIRWYIACLASARLLYKFAHAVLGAFGAETIGFVRPPNFAERSADRHGLGLHRVHDVLLSACALQRAIERARFSRGSSHRGSFVVRPGARHTSQIKGERGAGGVRGEPVCAQRHI